MAARCERGHHPVHIGRAHGREHGQSQDMLADSFGHRQPDRACSRACGNRNADAPGHNAHWRRCLPRAAEQRPGHGRHDPPASLHTDDGHWCGRHGFSAALLPPCPPGRRSYSAAIRCRAATHCSSRGQLRHAQRALHVRQPVIVAKLGHVIGMRAGGLAAAMIAADAMIAERPHMAPPWRHPRSPPCHPRRW